MQKCFMALASELGGISAITGAGINSFEDECKMGYILF